MVLLKRMLLICCVIFSTSSNVRASEILLKIACIETGALNTFRVPQEKFFGGGVEVDYSALAAALTHSVSAAADVVQKDSINSIRFIQPVLREIPALLQRLYPEQGSLIGRQIPNGSSGWYKYLMDFDSNTQVAFIELGVDRAVLDSLAIGPAAATVRARSIQQYAQGSTLNPDEVFTAGYSFFIQQLARGNAYEWLQNVMPLKNGIGLIALRRAGAETRTDTIILRIDPRYFPQNVSGKKEALIVLGWDRLQ